MAEERLTQCGGDPVLVGTALGAVAAVLRRGEVVTLTALAGEGSAALLAVWTWWCGDAFIVVLRLRGFEFLTPSVLPCLLSGAFLLLLFLAPALASGVVVV